MGSPYRTRETVRMIENPEEIHNAKAREEEGDMDVGWDITSKDVERLRQFLTPTIHTLPNLEPVVQPYIPLGPVHDKDKSLREKEQNYDIPLNDSGIKSLREDRDNLIDFSLISNLEAMLREFLVLLEGKQKSSTITINRGLIQAIPTSLPPQPIGEATKASNLQRIPPRVQGRSHFTYFLYLIVQITNPDSGFVLIAYSDADHAWCHDDCKSTSGGLKFLGEKLVSWSSKQQDCTALSTPEAEYVSLSACCAQVIWMRTQLLDYGYKLNRIPMYCDSKNPLAISCNLVQYSRTKHIDIRYHFIKEHVEKGTVELYFVGTEYQLADLFTKALPKERFEYLVHRIGMRCMNPTQLESLTKLSS
ncbi:hypothetical protein Tco_0116482 [Tanacetum coccineum]